MKKYILLNLSALFAFFLAACMFISCGKSKKSKPSEEGPGWSINPFSRSNAKSARVKCVNNLGSIFGLVAMKSELQTSKILVFPCDAERAAGNELLHGAWIDVNTRGGNPIPHDGLSYGLCLGGDFQRPDTVIAMTRNLSVDDLAKANWGGGSDKRRRMSGLKPSQGQLVLADGSARQSNNADLDAQGAERNIIKMHINARGGMSPLGSSKTKVMLPY